MREREREEGKKEGEGDRERQRVEGDREREIRMCAVDGIQKGRRTEGHTLIRQSFKWEPSIQIRVED